MNIGRTVLAALSATTLLTAFIPTPASADPHHPPPGSVRIEVATVNGAGCPMGTASVANNVDTLDNITVSYSAFTVETGGNSHPTAYRKNCEIQLKISTPPEFTYAILSADYRGFASLERGASGVLRSMYKYLSEQPGQRAHEFSGPLVQDWEFTDGSDLPWIVYKPCGEYRAVTLGTELQVDVGTSDRSKVSFASMDSTDGSILSTYHFAWKRCPMV
ncbi:DUF4360 domain-containing protein [Actinomadura macra]|uniref:DUF4360 domain-containing protein n=1 Tax=Actinomadura macra TaxID=46164 RepID=UPI00083644D2|nr:DUF4360 domain-containing protein [Actinomadura macra]